jgi:hypothetical protein
MSVKKISKDEVKDMFTDNAPIRISDAVDMFKRPISHNIKPYDKAVLTFNNDLVDEWYNKILKKEANDKGELKAAQIFHLWTIFVEGHEIKNLRKFKDNLPYVPEHVVNHWINILRDSPIEELLTIGSGVVYMAWQIIITSIRAWFANEKWVRVYSLSDDPSKWVRLANDNIHLFNGQHMVFGLDEKDLKDMAEKVNAILSHKIEPR